MRENVLSDQILTQCICWQTGPDGLATGERLGAEFHERVAQRVLRGEPLRKAITAENLASFPLWRAEHDEYVAAYALHVGCDTGAIAAKVAEMKPRRVPWWRRWLEPIN